MHRKKTSHRIEIIIMLPIVLVVICCCVSVIRSETCFGQTEKSLISTIQSSLKTLEEKLQGKSASRCPTGWEKYNNHCYYVSADKTKNWYKSERQCRDIGGYLVQVTDSAEDSWIAKLIQKTGQHSTSYWMGAANGKEGKWSWVNDSFKVQYSNWAPGEPSGGTNQCAQIWYRSNYKWDDTPCNRLGKGYICERTQEPNCPSY
ncbi:perlucin-like protein [Mytilus galloprovincialis]|uniref:perlucin-like protein n=1 Tax=Mytilus galloprovincialis TaxID=29158 RepID=UPI003F7B56F7